MSEAMRAIKYYLNLCQYLYLQMAYSGKEEEALRQLLQEIEDNEVSKSKTKENDFFL